MVDIKEFPRGGQHMGIAGVTGDGKTWWMVNNAKAHAQSGHTAVIIFNFKDKKKDPYDVPGDYIDGSEPKKALKAALKGQDMVTIDGQEYEVNHGQLLKFDAHWREDIKNKQLHNVYELCKEVSQETPESFEIRIYIEEADELGDAVDRIAKDGDGHGIYCHPLSQRMMDIGTGAGSQIKEWAIMGINTQQRQWCRSMGFPFQEIHDASNSDLQKDSRSGEAPPGYYQWAHVRGDRVESYPPIPGP